MKLADLLGVVDDSPLAKYQWHLSLIAALNAGVGEHAKVDETMTGKDIIVALTGRGTQHFLELMAADFDTATGVLLVEDTSQPAPAPEVVTVTSTAPVTVTTGQPEKYTMRQIIAYVAGIVIVLFALTLAVTMAITSAKNNGEFSPSQERMAVKVLDVLGDVAKTEKEVAAPKPAAPIQPDPIFGPPVDPTHPLYLPAPASDERPDLMQSH